MDAYNKYSFVSKRPGNLQAGAASSVGENSIPIADNRTVTSIQRKQNNTGLPDILKSRIENLSGYSMDDVKVHYNSAQPAQLNAHAHAQGTDIHIAPGQEKHLPHEAWHVVQQKQGRVKPTLQMKGKVNVNDDTGLEKEADIMGGEALRINTQDFVLQGKFFDRFRRVINSNKGIRQFVREAKTPGIDPAKRAAKSNEGHAGNRIRDELLEHKGFRKLNRISGQINQIGGMAPVSAALNAAIGAINAGPNPVDYAGIGALYDPVKAASVVVLDAAIALDPLPPLVGDQCLLLGTLDYWATNGHLSAEIPPKTEALRWKMQQRARMSIVAHRGMGATNKSFGGLIPDADPSRARKTENSGGAFATALAHASTPVQPWGLDGIECDVFLSQDGVPIVSHDGNISEQMSAARRVAFANPGATIGTTTAAALMALERKAAGDPSLAAGELPGHTVFVSLRQLLDMAAPVAAIYAAQHHKGFRCEIEMKGGNEGVHNIVDITAKTVSQFKKSAFAVQAADLEIVMFNGSLPQVAEHHEKRMAKTKLGGMVVGLGAAQPGPGVAKNPQVDEYRMSLSDPAQVRAVTGNYISTYVLGGEQEIRTGVAPIPLEWHKGPELQAFLVANAHSALSINQLWTAFQLAYPAVVIAEREFKYPMSVEKKRVDTASYRASQAALHGVVGQKTHLLTDYPEHVKTTRNEIGPEGDRIAAAIQNLLLTHDWVAHPMQGNKDQAGWTALLATVQSGHTFVHHHIRHNATAAEIITDLGV